ncbi:MAG: tRNA threonylcarbamoyladenosine biosynthesis protein TsaE [Nonlabens sp.]|jgi:tRNA threonylcarbamoyladenosine biosynthesis protein TsaE|uniref:tRNA (adenosine(37)-N6)-threonylcarbamoyltransferase complex ATPase subunit type 1 TsaE n=1 Tax=Nonlabens sp. TaxID=1888209 RepID=UPI0039E6E0B1
MEIIYTLNEIDHIAQLILDKTKSKVLLFKALMGSGKTTLIKSICWKLGVKGEITSPTFSIVNEYKGNLNDVFHFDLYRVGTKDNLHDIGFEDYLDKDAYCLIEWPELSIPFLTDYQLVEIKIVDIQTRKLILH